MQDALKFLSEVVNSNFAVAFVGGLTGAFGGALGAQQIVERAKQRQELLREIRNTNAATMAALSTCNAALALKRQHVQPMYEEFQKAKCALDDFRRKRATGESQANAEYKFVADLRTYPAPVIPIQTLKDLVFSGISAYGRALALVAVLEQTDRGLQDAVAKRDLLIHRFGSGSIPQEQVHCFYFGMPLPSGDTNQEYPDLVGAIHEYVDDMIFFSVLLCEDLVAHALAARGAAKKWLRKKLPEISTPDFSGPRRSGLIPPDTQYADWLKAFVEAKVQTPK